MASLYWRAKGRPFSDVLDANWATSVFSSAFGYYGYLYVPGSGSFYSAVKIGLSLIGIIILVTLWRSGNTLGRAAVAAMVVCFSGLVGITLWNSWTMDFQPQGRYFFSLAIMLGVVFYTLRHSLPVRVLMPIALFITGLSLFSFLFVGIPEIVK